MKFVASVKKALIKIKQLKISIPVLLAPKIKGRGIL